MVERFVEQQQALCAVLAEDRKKWHLMPKDNDITILETLKEVLEPLSPFTDALSGEKHTTLSSVLLLLWKMLSCLRDKEDDTLLTREMKSSVTESLNQRYENREVQLLLNTATYLDPGFKASFVALEDDVRQSLLEQVGNTDDGAGTSETTMAKGAEASSQSRPSKKSKTDLKHLLSAIQGEKKGSEVTSLNPQAGLSTQDKLNGEFLVYSKMPELSADEDPLIWWKINGGPIPQLAEFARRYLCIAASSCASERVFSVSGIIVSPRRSRLTQDNVNMLVFLSKNLELAKKSCEML